MAIPSLSGRSLYRRDIFGQRVLIGLTFSETREFELLDAEPPVDEYGHILRWETDDDSFPPNQRRWLKLYEKHRAACEGIGEADPLSSRTKLDRLC